MDSTRDDPAPRDEDGARRGQVNTDAAEVYDRFFVPALFEEWPARVLDAAGVQAGHRVLDVACGTGVLARAALEWVGGRGEVVGVDVNDGMLAVAARHTPAIGWRTGAAEALPFDDARFDRVVSQFGLMFFEDQAGALREMARVCAPGGLVAVAVWGRLEATPGYAAMVDLLGRIFGRREADALRAPYDLGDPDALRQLFTAAGISEPEIRTIPGTARFPSIRDWVHTDVRGWTLADMIDDAGFARLLAAAEAELAGFTDQTGAVTFAAPAHVAVFPRR